MEQKNKTTNNNININRYQEKDGVSMKTLDFGFWWVKNRDLLRKMLIIFLICISMVAWIYTLFNWSYYYASLSAQDEQMIKNLVNTTTVSNDFLVSKSAQNLKTSSVSIIEQEEKYDLFITLENPNKNYWGDISYCFMEGTRKIDCGKSFLLPGEKKYIMALGQTFDVAPRMISFVLEKTAWYKINPHEIPDWNAYRNEHLDFSITDKELTLATDSNLSDKLNINIFKFTITNDSPYDYYEVPLNIVLLKSNRVSAINRYIIKDFPSNETKEISINWPGYIGAISTAQIDTDLNILDEDIYGL